VKKILGTKKALESQPAKKTEIVCIGVICLCQIFPMHHSGQEMSPQNWDPGPNLTLGFLGLPESTPQTASRLVQPFSHSSSL